MASKKLTELLQDVQAISRQREAQRLKAKKLWEQINPLLEEAEAIRRAHPTLGAEPQSIGQE